MPKMTLTILVDSREPAEVKEAMAKLALEKGFISDSSTQLAAGDFAFIGTSNGEEISISIERKQAADLFSSIIDGRVKDQSARQCLNFQKICWIIEEDPFVPSYGTSTPEEYRKKKRQIIGTEVSLTKNKGAELYFTDDPEGTAYCVYKIIEYELNGKPSIDTLGKIMKYSNHDDYSVMTNCIGVIPLANGRTVGFTKAAVICEDCDITKFSDIQNLDMKMYSTLRAQKKLKQVTPKYFEAVLSLK